MDNVDERRRVMNRLRVEVGNHSSSLYDSSDDREEDGEARHQEAPAWSHLQPDAGGRRRLLSRQLSMKETTREAKWEKHRQQTLRRSSMVSIVGAAEGEEGKSPPAPNEEHRMRRSASASARCLTDEDLDELRGSFELGFGFDEETGGGNLRDTLPALDFYFAVNRQLSDPKLKTQTASPTSTLSAVSSSSTLLTGTPSPRSPSAGSGTTDDWKIFSPGDHPQLVKTRLRHWAQVVACSVKHGR